MVDTSGTVKIKGSPVKLLGLVGIGVLMTAVAAILAFRLVPDDRLTVVSDVVGFVAMIFFGFCTLVALWSVPRMCGTVVTLSPAGIRDRRLANRIIAWSAIKGISTWSHAGQHMVVLSVDPETEAQVGLSPIARLARPSNRRMGLDGLPVSAQALEIGHAELLELISCFFERWRSQPTS